MPFEMTEDQRHEEIWRLSKVTEVTGMGRSWLYSQISIGRFPQPVKLGERAKGWKKSDIKKWISERQYVEPIIARLSKKSEPDTGVDQHIRCEDVSDASAIQSAICSTVES
ncbi:MAG: AlpA family phage regulatory protein [Planktomarina sp.]|nr:AlpA family phage regulatory protein [Planktomarina sp.]